MEPLGNVGDAPHVPGDVVALDAVAAGERLDQAAVAVGQADGGAVEFQFAAVAERSAVERLVGPGGEFFDFRDGVGVAQRKHRIAVGTLDEALAGVPLGVGARSEPTRRVGESGLSNCGNSASRRSSSCIRVSNS